MRGLNCQRHWAALSDPARESKVKHTLILADPGPLRVLTFFLLLHARFFFKAQLMFNASMLYLYLYFRYARIYSQFSLHFHCARSHKQSI